MGAPITDGSEAWYGGCVLYSETGGLDKASPHTPSCATLYDISKPSGSIKEKAKQGRSHLFSSFLSFHHSTFDIFLL